MLSRIPGYMKIDFCLPLREQAKIMSDKVAIYTFVKRIYLVMFQKNSTVCENMGFRLYPLT